MKLLSLLVVLVFAAATPRQASAADATAPEGAAGAEGGSASGGKKYGVPPGMLKKGALPRGQAKKREPVLPPDDVLITNEQATSVVVEPRPAPPVVMKDDKRVQSPRGSEVLPQPGPSPAASAPPEPEPELRAATPKEERELEADLLKVIVSKANPRQAAAALARIAAETGTPAPVLEEQMQASPRLRGGDLLMGNKIASLSKKPAADVFADHAKTGKWLATGFNFGVAPGTLQKTAAGFVNSAP